MITERSFQSRQSRSRQDFRRAHPPFRQPLTVPRRGRLPSPRRSRGSDVAIPIKAESTPAPSFSTRTGVLRALPLISAYLPVSFAFGVLASGAGMSFAATAAMSIFCVAGSAQFAAVGLLGAAAPAWTIIATTFIVNFRHFLMSTAMAPRLRHWPRARRLWFGCQLTDETFALHITQFNDLDPGASHTLAINACAHLAWIAGTVLGYQAHAFLPDLKSVGMDFALTGMFIALVVLQWKDRWLGLAAIAAGASALGLKCLGAGHLATLLAAVIGASLAFVAEDLYT